MMLQILIFVISLGSIIACEEKSDVAGKLIRVWPLPKELNENSGMLQLSEDTYLGLNDSGNDAKLYSFHLKGDSGTRAININNAKNIDWEELASDDHYVYIGDTGNNSGKRKELTIYRVDKESLMRNDEVNAEIITFTYENQTKSNYFSKDNFDCEAMICVGDSLYLFSKNHGNQKTDLYSLPKVPGNHLAINIGRFDSDGLITSADIRKNRRESQLVLIGYKRQGNQYKAFLIYFPHVAGNRFFESTSRRVDFNTSLQIESVIYHDLKTVYISNERNPGDQALVFMANLPE